MTMKLILSLIFAVAAARGGVQLTEEGMAAVCALLL